MFSFSMKNPKLRWNPCQLGSERRALTTLDFVGSKGGEPAAEGAKQIQDSKVMMRKKGA